MTEIIYDMDLETMSDRAQRTAEEIHFGSSETEEPVFKTDKDSF